MATGGPKESQANLFNYLVGRTIKVHSFIFYPNLRLEWVLYRGKMFKITVQLEQ